MRVALYARVSTEDQVRHGLSIEAQIAALDEWAKDKTIVDHYIDPGISARKPASKRPDLQRLLRDVEAGKIDLIAFTKLDRWTRAVKEYHKVQEILDKHHVAWRAIQEDYETETAAGRFKVNIMLAIAEDEADRTGERVKAVFQRKKERGESCGGRVPFGISVVDKHRVANEDAPKAKALFDHFLATNSVRSTTRASERITGKAMSYDSVKQMLSNKTYVETGIVSPEVFDRVQDLRRQRGSRQTTAGRIYLFSGIARCAICGGRLSGHVVKGTYLYWCQKARNAGSCENTSYIRQNVIEEHLLRELLLEAKRMVIRAKKKMATVDTAAIKRRMERLNDLYLDGRISKERYDSEYIGLERALNAAQRTPQPPDVKVYSSALEAYKGLTDAGKRAFWLTAVESVECADKEVISFTLRG